MEAKMAAAIAHQRAGRLDEAERIYLELLSSGSDDARVLHQYGLVELARSRYAEAIALIGRAIERRDDDANMHSNLGEAYRRTGDLAGAFRHFKRALELEPTLPVAHLNLGVLMRAQGMMREAEHFLLQAIMLFPDLPKAHMELGRLYIDEDRNREAVECMRSVVALSPGQADAYYLLGGALAYCGDTLGAIAAHERALALGYAEALLELTRLRFEMAWEALAVKGYCEMQPQHTRVITVHEGTLERWCAFHQADYRDMGEKQVLPLGLRPPTLPESFAASWPPGKAVVPPAFMGFVRTAEVVRPGFAVIADGREILLEGIVAEYLHYPYGDGPVRFNADDGRMLLDLMADPPHHAGGAFLLGEGGDRYRWLYESLARLWFVEQIPALRGLPLVVAAELGRDEREMLRVACGAEPQLISVAAGQAVKVDELAVSSLLVLAETVSQVGIQYLRRKFSTGGLGAGPGRRIFMSRRNFTSRRIANEDALLPQFEANGFEVVDAASIGWRERLATFEHASVIIGIDDEAMADLFIVPQGARVGVIVAEGMQNTRAWRLSAQLGHRFCYMQGRPLFDSHARHDECDIELDPGWLKLFIATL